VLLLCEVGTVLLLYEVDITSREIHRAALVLCILHSSKGNIIKSSLPVTTLHR
jgi:hypothetical protein